jgi:predicted DNA-binding transcriptional regulator AlpA
MANRTDKISKPAEEIIKDHLLLKTVEVLKVLNISRGTFEKLQRKEGFPKAITNVGNRPMWLTEEILKWVKIGRC